jgi:hypothetical protein
MQYLTAAQAASVWPNTRTRTLGVTVRYVTRLCEQERVEGAHKPGRDWVIPRASVPKLTVTRK